MDAATIKRLLKETRHTQRELAAHLNVDPAAITRLLRGERRLRLDEAPKVEAFFGLASSGSAGFAQAPGSGVVQRAAAGNVDLRPSPGNPNPDMGPRDLPVYASAQGGPDGMSIDYQPVEWMRRPQTLEGVVDAFAFYVVGDSMAPRFRHGERLLVHPKRPPRPGEDILLLLKDVDKADVNAMVKTLVGRNADAVTVAQYNPAKEFDIPAESVGDMLLIVGSHFYG